MRIFMRIFANELTNKAKSNDILAIIRAAPEISAIFPRKTWPKTVARPIAMYMNIAPPFPPFFLRAVIESLLIIKSHCFLFKMK